MEQCRIGKQDSTKNTGQTTVSELPNLSGIATGTGWPPVSSALYRRDTSARRTVSPRRFTTASDAEPAGTEDDAKPAHTHTPHTHSDVKNIEHTNHSSDACSHIHMRWTKTANADTRALKPPF